MSSRRDFLCLRAAPEPERIDVGRRRSVALMLLLALVLCVMPRATAEMYLDWLFRDTKKASKVLEDLNRAMKRLASQGGFPDEVWMNPRDYATMRAELGV